MGLYIYKKEKGCEDVTPKLDDNIKLINAKQKELVNMKDRINLEWVSGKWIPFCSKAKTTSEFITDLIIQDLLQVIHTRMNAIDF